MPPPLASGPVAADSAVAYGHCRVATAECAPRQTGDAATVDGRVAAQGAVCDRHRRVAFIGVVKDTSAVVTGRVVDDSAVGDRQRRHASASVACSWRCRRLRRPSYR